MKKHQYIRIQGDLVHIIRRIDVDAEMQIDKHNKMKAQLDRIEKLLASLTDVSISGFKLVVIKPDETANDSTS